MRLSTGLLALIVSFPTFPAGAADLGIVVDEVAPDSEVEKAGVAVGDVLLSWERLAAPPANPEPARGDFRSPFDWMWLEVEQVHRGTVVLTGERRGEARTWRVAAGEWNVHFNQEKRSRSRARPRLDARWESEYLRGLGEIHRGQRDAGLARWRRLAEHIPPNEADPLRAWLLLRIGEIHGEVGEWEPAYAAFAEAAGLARDLRTRVFIGEAQAKSFEYRGQFSAAQDVFRTVLALREATEPGGLGIARSHHQLGSMSWVMGHLQEAGAGFDRALELRSRGAPGSFPESDSLQTQGMVASERMDFEAAEHFLERSVEIQERLGPNSFWMAPKLEGLGDIYASRGDLEVAAAYYERSLAIRERLVPDGESMAASLVRLARTKRSQGHPEESLAFLERARSILARVFPRQPSLAAVYNDLGGSALDLDRWADAERSYRRALAHFAEVTPDRPWTAESWYGLGLVAERTGRQREATAHFEKALAIYRGVGPGSEGQARLLAALGRLGRNRGDLAVAAAAYAQALVALENQVGRLGGSEDVKAGFRALRREIYFDAAAVEISRGHLEAAFDIQEAARAQGFLNLLAARNLDLSADLPPALEERRRRIGREYARALASLHPLSLPTMQEPQDEPWRRLPLLRAELDAVEAEVRRQSPHAAELQFPRPLSARQLAAELDPGLAILAYQVGPESTHVFVLQAGRAVEARVVPVGRAALGGEVGRLLATFELHGTARRPSALEPLAALYRYLVAPVEPLLAGSERLLILPDGPLHAVPWGALVGAPPQRGFLVEWRPFTIALSGTVWAELRRLRRPPGSTAGTRLAAFGDPAFAPEVAASGPNPHIGLHLRAARRRGLSLTELPATRREVTGIANLFPNETDVFLGKEATEQRARGLPRQTRIVHFATHGFVDERIPLSSGLALAASTRPQDSTDDGFLQVWEIFERIRLDADLVVLSACDSGRGQDKGGEGLQSLTRAFQYAGARAVLATLWKVEDEASADLMIRFYRHLKSSTPTADALREAQLEAIAKSRAVGVEDGGAAGLWSAFEVFGDGG